jgi:hypothetical protein
MLLEEARQATAHEVERGLHIVMGGVDSAGVPGPEPEALRELRGIHLCRRHGSN